MMNCRQVARSLGVARSTVECADRKFRRMLMDAIVGDPMLTELLRGRKPTEDQGVKDDNRRAASHMYYRSEQAVRVRVQDVVRGDEDDRYIEW